ncbi:MAG: T9SS type A sorting domain-containing protein [Crocinitomicaceae bacterium]|nr:T9SS type A sorting domain-containing protein [Crocinitomicaceae bacterium]
MKRKLTLLTAAIISSFGLSAQSSLVYSLDRYILGSDLKLIETNLSLNTETEIDSYTSVEIDDIDPSITTFDNQNGRFITLTSDDSFNISLTGFNTSNGNIDYSYPSVAYELGSIEYYEGKVYSLARPMGGGDLKLLETNLSSGLETVIDTYSSSELNDYNPETTTFDYQNGRFIIFGYDLGGNMSVVGLNVGNGDIDYSYVSSAYELGSIEYYGGKVYSLARPAAGGDLKLLETNLSSGIETVIDTYPSSELNDYNPEATCFDHQYGRFMTLGSDLGGSVNLISINVTNGDIDYSFASPTYELFCLESAGDLPADLNEQIDLDDLISIYPNPSQNLIKINSSMKYDKLEIVNILGVVTFSTRDKSTILDISHLSSGTYWLRLSSASETQIKQFVKK